MGLFGWILYVFLGIIFYFIISFIDNKYNLSKIDKIVFSIILLIFVAGFFFNYLIKYTDNLFLVFVFMMITDIIFNTYIVGRDFFDENERNIIYYIVMILIGFFVNQNFINRVSFIFPSGDDLRLVIWLLIIIYLYNFIKNKKLFGNTVIKNNKYMSVRSVLNNYSRFKYMFYDDCEHQDNDFSNILYAIMIYEDNRRSKFLRDYDNFMYKINGGKSKLGIMQVESKKFISDSESISIVYKKIAKLYDKKKNNDINKIFDDYYGYDNQYVKYIYDIIKKF